jgi:hypothetical protein
LPSLGFHGAGGVELEAPLEWAACLVVLSLPADRWSEHRLERDGEVLPLSLRMVDGEERVVAEWPRSGTGSYELLLTHADGRREASRCLVKSRKIDADAYAELLTDLETRLPASIVIGLKRLGALTGIELGAPGASAPGEELAKLRRAVDGSPGRPGLAAILVEVDRDPHRAAVDSETWVDRDRARRVHPARLGRALADGGNLDRDGLPRLLPEAQVRESVDVFENRLLKMFKQQVERRLSELEAALGRQSESQSRRQALGECEALRERLSRAAKAAAFLAEVEPLSRLPDQPTMVVWKRAEYRCALEGLLALRRRAGAHLQEPNLEAPLERLPFLYETWGTLQAIDLLLALASELGFDSRQQTIARFERGSVFVRILRGNRPALRLVREVDGTVVSVVPRRRYPSEKAPFESASFRQEPDVAIEIERPGAPSRLFLFDPKYKLASGGEGGNPKKEDIDTMHAYRDAIRDADGHRVVRHASILYPGPSKPFGDGLSAISAVPGAADQLREELRAVLLPALSAEGSPAASA